MATHGTAVSRHNPRFMRNPRRSAAMILYAVTAIQFLILDGIILTMVIVWPADPGRGL